MLKVVCLYCRCGVVMAEAVKEKEKLERKSSKSRLAKQDEVEEVEEDNDNSPSSEASDATVIPAGKKAESTVNKGTLSISTDAP